MSAQAAILEIKTSKRLFIFDKINKCEFLVDSGADHSVLAPTPIMREIFNKRGEDNEDTGACYYAANGTQIRTFGTKLLELNLILRRAFTWRFTVADVTTSIIGADFLYEFGLLVDLRGKQLIDQITGLTTKGTVRSIKVPQVSIFNTTQSTLKRFNYVFF